MHNVQVQFQTDWSLSRSGAPEHRTIQRECDQSRNDWRKAGAEMPRLFLLWRSLRSTTAEHTRPIQRRGLSAKFALTTGLESGAEQLKTEIPGTKRNVSNVVNTSDKWMHRKSHNDLAYHSRSVITRSASGKALNHQSQAPLRGLTAVESSTEATLDDFATSENAGTGTDLYGCSWDEETAAAEKLNCGKGKSFPVQSLPDVVVWSEWDRASGWAFRFRTVEHWYQCDPVHFR